MAFFSVVIPLYNKAKYIAKTLDAVLQQTFVDFEVIVVNDGSTDASLKSINTVNDERLFVYTTKNNGVSAARNFGVSKATANYIAFIDADDLWLPNHLQILKNLIEDFPKHSLYCTGYKKAMSNKSVIRAQFGTIEDRFRGVVEHYFKNSLPFSIAWMGAVVVSKAQFIALGGFSTLVTHGEDIELWTKFAIYGNVVLHNVPTAVHQLQVAERLSHVNIAKKVFPNYNQFIAQERIDKDLKYYLDNNRYAIALQYKIANQNELYNFWKAQIDQKHLNFKQRLVFNMPTIIVKLLQNVQQYLTKNGLYISTFR